MVRSWSSLLHGGVERRDEHMPSRLHSGKSLGIPVRPGLPRLRPRRRLTPASSSASRHAAAWGDSSGSTAPPIVAQLPVSMRRTSRRRPCSSGEDRDRWQYQELATHEFPQTLHKGRYGHGHKLSEGTRLRPRAAPTICVYRRRIRPRQGESRRCRRPGVSWLRQRSPASPMEGRSPLQFTVRQPVLHRFEGVRPECSLG